MRVRPVLLLSLLALVLGGTVGTGCFSTPELKTKGRVDVPVSASADPARVSVDLLSEVVLHLPPLTTPGTEWVVVRNDVRFLKPLRPIEPGPNGEFLVAFAAIRQGRRLVGFLALPPNEREAVATQTYATLIEIK